ncbi:hypothetical protein DV737_g2091, partial [Chaetothyriales sp. CBS 132003]
MAHLDQNLENIGTAIAQLSKSLADQLKALDQREPSFAADTPASFPQNAELQQIRVKLLDSLASLQHLVTGASDFWINGCLFPNHDLLTFDVLNSFNFWDAVPLNGSASYSEIAKSTNLPESIVRRFLRYAFTLFVFTESPLGSENVVHTSASAYIARSRFVQAFLAHNLEDIRPATTVGVNALKKWVAGHVDPPQEVTTCAMPLATDDGVERRTDFWTYIDNFERHDQPKGFRAKRFAEAMQGLTQNTATIIEATLKLFDWKSLNDATVVDLGGSAGHISAILAENYPKLSLVVQDLPAVESAFNTNFGSSRHASRVKFQKHDFFNVQETSADVFLVKSVFHDWSDKYVLQIVRNLLGVFKPGNHLLIFDSIVPESEKAQSMLYRFRATQASESGLLPTSSTRRPKAPSTVSTIPACEKFRGQILRDVSRKLLKIQDESLSDAQVRDLNDEINKLMKEKWSWERRIKEYYGRAKELPGVKEMLERAAKKQARRAAAGKRGDGGEDGDEDGGGGRADLQRRGLDARYFGWGDDEADGSLLRRRHHLEAAIGRGGTG